MEIFGVGPAELVLILIVVLIVFGPEQLPEIAKKIGGATRDLRSGLDDITNEMNENLQPFKDLGDATKLLPAEPQATTPTPPAEAKTDGQEMITPAIKPEQPSGDSSQS
jgi:sec-independent protein translocase protein TatA